MLFNVRPTSLDENVFDIKASLEKYETLSPKETRKRRWKRFVEQIIN